ALEVVVVGQDLARLIAEGVAERPQERQLVGELLGRQAADAVGGFDLLLHDARHAGEQREVLRLGAGGQGGRAAGADQHAVDDDAEVGIAGIEAEEEEAALGVEIADEAPERVVSEHAAEVALREEQGLGLVGAAEDAQDVAAAAVAAYFFSLIAAVD